MKILVKLFQFSIVLVMLYPLYYVWETDKIKTVCQLIKPGMTYNDIVMDLQSKKLGFSRMNGAQTVGEKWLGLVESKASFSGYACEIRGSGNQVAGVRIVKDKQIAP